MLPFLIMQLALLTSSLSQQIELAKKEEFYLDLRGTKGITLRGLPGKDLIISKRNRIIIPTSDKLWSFTQNYKVDKIFGGRGSGPGRFLPVPLEATLFNGNKIAIPDLQGRINIFTDEGDFVKSIIVPNWSAVSYQATLCDSLLITAGRFFDKETLWGIRIYDLTTGKRTAQFFPTVGKEKRLAEEKNIMSRLIPHFTITPNATLLCNKRTDYRVFEYKLKGNLLFTYNERPPHYISPFEVDRFERSKMSTPATNTPPGAGCAMILNEEGKRWFSSWTKSGCPSLYRKELFIVSREERQGFLFLDFYSLSTKKYLGFYKTEKAFLFSDSNYIYLCEHIDEDSILVIGKYEATIPYDEGKQQQKEVLLDTLPAVEESVFQALTEAMKSSEDTAFPSPNTISEFKIKDVEGKNTSLLSCLFPDKYHFLLFTHISDCKAMRIYEKMCEFIQKERKEFDGYIVINHPWKENLRPYVNGSNLKVPFIANFAPKRIKNLGISHLPTLLVVDKEGGILGRFCPYTSEISIERFLNEMEMSRDLK